MTENSILPRLDARRPPIEDFKSSVGRFAYFTKNVWNVLKLQQIRTGNTDLKSSLLFPHFIDCVFTALFRQSKFLMLFLVWNLKFFCQISSIFREDNFLLYLPDFCLEFYVNWEKRLIVSVEKRGLHSYFKRISSKFFLKSHCVIPHQMKNINCFNIFREIETHLHWCFAITLHTWTYLCKPFRWA